jgi:hypothetical protein
MAKGQAKFIEYLLTVVLSAVFLAIVSLMINTFYTNALKGEIKDSLKQLAIQIGDNVVKVYETAKLSNAQPSNNTNILLNELKLSLPDAVSKRNYRIRFISTTPIWVSIKNITVGGLNATWTIKPSGATIQAETTEDPKVSVEHYLPNVDVGVQGQCENGQNSVLKYYRFNINGTVKDKIVLGEASAIIDITSIS